MVPRHGTGMTVKSEIAPDHMQAAAVLFWQAFRGKLGPVMRPEAKALIFFERVIDPTHVITAVAADGALLGIAGFKTEKGSFVGGELSDLQTAYGWFGGLWRGLLLSILERTVEADVLLMDGIVVSEAARGQGIGTLLLRAIKEEAVMRGCASVRLDVIDSNPRAKALYEREGFAAGERTALGPLRHLFGFRASTRMDCPIGRSETP
ncbi:GNAT family N-acetyltransferase [Rhodobacteraceae bacterium]|nr:GNAT family N-acetyltransferase [Paracoccaceae bacterium]